MARCAAGAGDADIREIYRRFFAKSDKNIGERYSHAYGRSRFPHFSPLSPRPPLLLGNGIKLNLTEKAQLPYDR